MRELYQPRQIPGGYRCNLESSNIATCPICPRIRSCRTQACRFYRARQRSKTPSVECRWTPRKQEAKWSTMARPIISAPSVARSASRRVRRSFLPLPVLVLSMFGEMLGLRLAPSVRNAIEFFLATPVVLWGGWPFFERFWASLVNRSPNMFTLIGLGTGAAYLDSVLATFFPQIFPASFRSMDGAAPVYFEAAAVITTLVLLGQVLELRARQQTSGAIRSLLNLAPQQAHLLSEDGSEKDVQLDQIQRGDHLRVRPGERVPVDGVIQEGASAIDES